jgi:hypothetical protein
VSPVNGLPNDAHPDGGVKFSMAPFFTTATIKSLSAVPAGTPHVTEVIPALSLDVSMVEVPT